MQYRNRQQYRFRIPSRPSQHNHTEAIEAPPMRHQSTETLEYKTNQTRRNQPNLRTRLCHQYTIRIYSQLIPLSIQILPLRILLTNPLLLSHQNSSKYLATLTILPNNPKQKQPNLFLRHPIIRQIYQILPIPTPILIITVPLPTSVIYIFRAPPTTSYRFLANPPPKSRSYLSNRPIILQQTLPTRTDKLPT